MKNTKSARKAQIDSLVCRLNDIYERYSKFGVPLNCYETTRLPHCRTAAIIALFAIAIFTFLGINYELVVIHFGDVLTFILVSIVTGVLTLPFVIEFVLALCYVSSRVKQITYSASGLENLLHDLHIAEQSIEQYAARVAKVTPLVDKLKKLEPVITNDLEGALEIFLNWEGFYAKATFWNGARVYALESKVDAYTKLALDCDEALRDKATLDMLETHFMVQMPQDAKA